VPPAGSLTHDSHALPALKAYVKSCRKDYPVLAADLEAKIVQMQALKSAFFTAPSSHRP
jgi:hypothetical protein